MRKFILLIWLIVYLTFLIEPSSGLCLDNNKAEETVVVTGTGDTFYAAEKAALNNAIKKVVGFNLEASTIYEDFKLSEYIKDYSFGYIKTYTVLSQTVNTIQKQDVDEWTVTVEATVKKAPILLEFLNFDVSSQQFDGRLLDTSIKNRKVMADSIETFISKIFEDFPSKSFDVIIQDKVVEDFDGLNTTVKLVLKTSLNRDWILYSREILSKFAVVKPEETKSNEYSFLFKSHGLTFNYIVGKTNNLVFRTLTNKEPNVLPSYRLLFYNAEKEVVFSTDIKVPSDYRSTTEWPLIERDNNSIIFSTDESFISEIKIHLPDNVIQSIDSVKVFYSPVFKERKEAI
jgi:hypothetical protein